MLNVNGVQAAAATNAVEPVGKALNVAAPAEAAGIGDVVEISTAARLAAMVQDIPEVRADLVARIKAEIASGTYETDERMEVAMDRLLDDLMTS